MQVSIYISVDLADINMVIQVVSLMFYLDHHVLGIYWHVRIQWQYDVPNCTLWLKIICKLTKEKIDPVGDTVVASRMVSSRWLSNDKSRMHMTRSSVLFNLQLNLAVCLTHDITRDQISIWKPTILSTTNFPQVCGF